MSDLRLLGVVYEHSETRNGREVRLDAPRAVLRLATSGGRLRDVHLDSVALAQLISDAARAALLIAKADQ